MITAEVAIYPQKTDKSSDVINNSISALRQSNIKYSVNSLNTKLTGSEHDIFTSLQTMFQEAEKGDSEINMVVTISNAAE